MKFTTKSLENELGFNSGQRRSASELVIKNAILYNQDGDRVGNGDLNATDIGAIVKLLDEGQVCIILHEIDAVINIGLQSMDIQGATGSMDYPGIAYIINYACMVIAKGHAHIVINHKKSEIETGYMGEMILPVVNRDELKDLLRKAGEERKEIKAKEMEVMKEQALAMAKKMVDQAREHSKKRSVHLETALTWILVHRANVGYNDVCQIRPEHMTRRGLLAEAGLNETKAKANPSKLKKFTEVCEAEARDLVKSIRAESDPILAIVMMARLDEFDVGLGIRAINVGSSLSEQSHLFMKAYDRLSDYSLAYITAKYEELAGQQS
jgi:uncharacterized membrane protein